MTIVMIELNSIGILVYLVGKQDEPWVRWRVSNLVNVGALSR